MWRIISGISNFLFGETNNENNNIDKSNNNISNSISNNNFVQKLFDIMERDCIFSLFNISSLLALIQLGSSEITLTELTKILNKQYTITELSDLIDMFNNPFIKTVNIILVNQNYPIKLEYLKMINELALISNENFSDSISVSKKTNQLIEKYTNSLIKRAISPNDINENFPLILISIIYFKANWKESFDPADTSEKVFYNQNGETKVDMMKITNSFSYFEDTSYQVLNMLYENDDYAMTFILSKSDFYLDNKIPIDEFMNIDWNSLRKEEVTVYLPKFTHRKRIDLTNPLQLIGLNNLFNCNAKLDKIADNIYITKIIHEAVVVIDEKGTEASALMNIGMAKSSFGGYFGKERIFNANHPFAYYISHIPSKTILFIGEYHFF